MTESEEIAEQEAGLPAEVHDMRGLALRGSFTNLFIRRLTREVRSVKSEESKTEGEEIAWVKQAAALKRLRKSLAKSRRLSEIEGWAFDGLLLDVERLLK